MNKKYLIFGGVGIVAVLVYILFSRKKSNTPDEILETSLETAAQNMSSLYTANRSAVDPSQYSQADIDYNDAVRRYQLKYKTQPDRSWTTEEIEQRIKDYDKIQQYIKQYIELEEKYDEGDELKTDKELGRMNADELMVLIKKVEEKNKRTEDSNKKAKWNLRKQEIGAIVDAFIENFTNFGTWAGDAKAYDIAVFQKLIDLPKNEKIYADQHFKSRGGIMTNTNWHDYCKKPYKATSIYSAIMPSNCSVYRDRAAKNGGAKNQALEKIEELRSAYTSVTGSLNAYGEIV